MSLISQPTGDRFSAMEDSAIVAAYRASTRDGLRDVAFPGLIFLLIFGIASGLIEALYFPERRRALLVLNATYLAAGLGHVMVTRLRPAWSVGSTLVVALIVHLSVIAYFTVARGSAELCLVIVSALLTSQVIVYPWNAVGQLISAVVPMTAYIFALRLGLVAHLPDVYPVFALATTVMLTTVGAGRLDRHRFDAFRRAKLLERSAEEQREERALLEALLDVARAMNQAIADPQVLADELADHTRRALGVDWVVVHRWSPDAQRFVLTSGAGMPPGVAGELDAIGGSEWLARIEPALAATGSAEFRMADGLDPLTRILFERWKVACVRIEPVVREQRRVGIITCLQLGAVDRMTEAQRRMLTAIATQAGVALENAGLVEAARAAERLKDEFVATVSHELRTPLNVILGYVGVILEGTFGSRPPEETDALLRVHHHGLQLLDLIQGLLDINRLEARGATLSLRRFPVKEVIESVRQTIPDTWRRRGVDLRWQNAECDAVVRTDFGKLEIILRNLIHNALKFTEEGAVTIRIETHYVVPEVRFVVSDTGCGISEADLSVIFDMFGQGKGGQRAGGFGLGLFIVKRLADALGGRLEVTSVVGQGTRFSLTLPTEP